MLDDTTKYLIGKRTFALGLSCTNFTTRKTLVNYLMDETYFKLEFYNAFYTDASDTFDRAFNLINIVQCTRELFPYTRQKLYDRLLIDRYLCPESNEYILMGNFNSMNFSDIKIFVSK